MVVVATVVGVAVGVGVGVVVVTAVVVGVNTVDLLIDALAVARLSRLVTSDAITRKPRAALIREGYERRDGREKGQLSPAGWEHVIAEDDEPPMLAEFVTCRYCVSIYAAFGVVAARRLFPRAWSPIARALAFSHVASLLAGLE